MSVAQTDYVEDRNPRTAGTIGIHGCSGLPEGLAPFPEVLHGGKDFLFVHGVNLYALPNALDEGDGEFAAQMLAKFLQSFEDDPVPMLALRKQQVVIKPKTQFFKQGQAAFGSLSLYQADAMGVSQVHGQANGDGVAMTDSEVGYLLELVGYPVPKIEGAGGTLFKRIPG